MMRAMYGQIQWTRELFSHWQNWHYWFTFPHPKYSGAQKMRGTAREIPTFLSNCWLNWVERCQEIFIMPSVMMPSSTSSSSLASSKMCDAPQCIAQICDPFSIWFADSIAIWSTWKMYFLLSLCLCGAGFMIFIQFFDSHNSVIVLKLKCITVFPETGWRIQSAFMGFDSICLGSHSNHRANHRVCSECGAGLN